VFNNQLYFKIDDHNKKCSLSIK